jgi:hypothetical protein
VRTTSYSYRRARVEGRASIAMWSAENEPVEVLTSNELTKWQAGGNGWRATRERLCGRIWDMALVPMDGGRGLEKVWVELVGYWLRESRREVWWRWPPLFSCIFWDGLFNNF